MSELVPFELTSGEGLIVRPSRSEEEYDPLLEDLWVGVALAFLVLSCIGCLCAAFLFHAFKQWQRNDAEARNVEAGSYDTESLPSYTLVAGLPTYEEAIEELKRSSRQDGDSLTDSNTPPSFSRLSVGDLLEVYKVKLEKK